MKKFILIAYPLFLISILTYPLLFAQSKPNLPQDEQSFNVQPISISITKQLDAKEYSFDTLLPQPGTCLSAIISPEDRTLKIVGIDVDTSQILSFTDNLKTNLLQSPIAANKPSQDSQSPSILLTSNNFPSPPLTTSISSNHQHILIDFAAPQVPDSKATTLNLKANLSLMIATGTYDETYNNIALKEGRVSALKKYNIAISNIHTASWGRANLVVGLSMPLSVNKKIASIQFLDQQGNDITSSRVSRTVLLQKAQLEYALISRPDTFTLKITFYENIQSHIVPLNITSTLGL